MGVVAIAYIETGKRSQKFGIYTAECRFARIKRDYPLSEMLQYDLWTK